MCRWLAYSGSPILMKEALYGGENSLVDQSLHSRLGAEPTNGDGFGVGWYGDRPPRACFTASSRPGTTRTCARSPATSAPRCSSRISGRRSAAPCSRPTATPSVTTAGCSCTTATSTSSPRSSATSSLPSTRRCTRRSKARPTPRSCSTSRSPSVWRMTRRPQSRRRSGSSKQSRERHGVPHPFQGTVATTDGESIWAFRYSSERKSRSLFYTTDVPRLRQLHPEIKLLEQFSDNARLIVSEPLGEVAGVWNEVPESTYGHVGPDHAELLPFEPKAPATSVPVGA